MLPFHNLTGARGKLAENVMHFARLLREAGLPIGPDRVIDCVDALSLPGFLSSARGRSDFYWTLSALLLSREQQRPSFDQAFALFWRDPKLAEKMMQLLLPKVYAHRNRAGTEPAPHRCAAGPKGKDGCPTRMK